MAISDTATHALLTAHCSAGDHVILPQDLYGGTYRLVDKVLARFGLDPRVPPETRTAAATAYPLPPPIAGDNPVYRRKAEPPASFWTAVATRRPSSGSTPRIK